MKVTIRNLMSPKVDSNPKYFQFLPYFSMVKDKDGTHWYLGWLHICIALMVENKVPCRTSRGHHFDNIEYKK